MINKNFIIYEDKFYFKNSKKGQAILIMNELTEN